MYIHIYIYIHTYIHIAAHFCGAPKTLWCLGLVVSTDRMAWDNKNNNKYYYH